VSEIRTTSGHGPPHAEWIQSEINPGSVRPVADPDDTTNPRCPASGVPGVPTSSRARRLPWADLLRRVFGEDVLLCPCGGHRSITAFVIDERLARSLLTTLGLAAKPTTFAPARAPQVEFAWDDPA
jgi:hypothetical protein